MFGLLTTIPLMLTIIAFIANAWVIAHGDFIKKVNRTTRRYQLIIANALIIGTLPFVLAIINGIYFDLQPDDPYLPLALDRFAAVGAYCGVCIISSLVTISFIRLSFLLDISKEFAKSFGLFLLISQFLSGCPTLVEACLFATKAINDTKYLHIARVILLIEDLFAFSFVGWYVVSLFGAMKELSKAKKRSRDTEVFQKIFRNNMAILAFLILHFIFFALLLAVDFRSKEYMIFYNLCGSCIGFSFLPMIDIFIISNTLLIEIVDKSRKPIKKVMAPVAMEMINSVPPTIALDAAKTTEIMK